MACNDYVCPGGFTVYRNIVEVGETVPTALQATNFVKVPEVLSWSLEPSTDTPTGFRTADTGGTRVRPCVSGTEWTVTVTTKICISNWLYDLILDPAAMVDGWYLGSTTLEGWWYLSFNNAPPSATALPTDQGIFIFGQPTPPGISGDNDSDEAANAEFTIEISNGPYFPNL